MDKPSVIALRDSLLNNGQNRAIVIAFDNGINLSLSSDLVIWDDEKEIVVGIVSDNKSGSYEAGLPIRIIGSTYENIQFISGNTNVDNLKELLDSLSGSVKITDETKKTICNWFEKVYDYKYDLNHKNYNPIDIPRD